MDWNSDKQSRFDSLRRKEMAGSLTAEEQNELTGLTRELETDEERQLAPGLARMRAEQQTLRDRIRSVQSENEELAKLLGQQEQLLADARRWLAQFEQRHIQIQQAYSRLTGETLAVSAS